MRITINYVFEDKPFDYDVDVCLSNFLRGYLEETYATVKEAVAAMAKDGQFLDDDEKKQASQCKDFASLAEFIQDADEGWANYLVENDKEFMKDVVEEQVRDENEEAAYKAFQEEEIESGDGLDNLLVKAGYYR